MLSGPEIIRQRDLGNIIIKPFDEKFVGPNSYDLHLGDTLIAYSHVGRKSLYRGALVAIDSKSPPKTHQVRQIQGGGWLLQPGKLYLGATKEYTETRGFVPRIDGRSSAGRLGIFCHVTAGLGDNGFCGTWTVELVVVELIIIYPGQRLFQITYEPLQGEQTLYGETKNEGGRYQKQSAPTRSRIAEEAYEAT